MASSAYAADAATPGQSSFLPAAKPRRSMDDVWPSSSSPGNIYPMAALRGKRAIGTWIIEVTEFTT